MRYTTKDTFKNLRFSGGRFDDIEGFLDFEILQELQVYMGLLVETAKELWRRANPDRKRLPAGFEEDFRLGISQVTVGSCVVTIKRPRSFGAHELPMPIEDEFDDAASIIDDTLLALQKNGASSR